MLPIQRLLLLLLLALNAAQAWALDTVTLQLKWKHQFQFAGYYIAQEKGYYRDAGLAVQLREASDNTNPITEVLNGTAQYGVSGPELAMLRAQGQPVVALAAIIQHSPLVLLTHDRIESIQDLKGRRIMLLPYETELFAYLKREGIAYNQIDAIPHSFDYHDLITGKVDAISGYVTDEPFDLQAARFKFRQYSPRAAGIDFYGDTLFTSEEYLQQHREQVAAFREASLRGWRYALDHPEEATDLILTHYSQRHSREHLLSEAAEIRHLAYPDLVEVGHMSANRWQHIAEVYAEAGLIPPGSKINGLLYEPQQAIIPDWMVRSLALTLALVGILGLMAWRFHRLSKNLGTTLQERDQALADQDFSRKRLQMLLDSTPVAIIVWDEGYKVTEWNQAAESTFGWTREEMLGRNFTHLLNDEKHLRDAHLAIQQNIHGYRTEAQVQENRTKTGRPLLCSWTNTRCCDETGGDHGYISIVQDITEQTRIADALSESERRYRTLLEIAPFPVTVSRLRDGAMVFCNQRAARQLGLNANNIDGLYVPKFWEHPEQRNAFMVQLQETGFIFDQEVLMRTIKGENFWVMLSAILIAKPGDASEVFVSFNNITERKLAETSLHQANMDLQLRLTEIEELQHKLQEQAIRDSLTGLYNRRYLTETLDREIARARREGHPLALVLIDLDHFKELNDNLGHQAGDAVLRQIAQYFMQDTRTEDLVCRYGGEEFLIMMPGMGLDKAVERSEHWRRTLAELTLTVSRNTLNVTASFGVAVYPENGVNPDQVIHAADTALYAAKRDGRNRVHQANFGITRD